jgi:hypothetical protein
MEANFAEIPGILHIIHSLSGGVLNAEILSVAEFLNYAWATNQEHVEAKINPHIRYHLIKLSPAYLFDLFAAESKKVLNPFLHHAHLSFVEAGSDRVHCYLLTHSPNVIYSVSHGVGFALKHVPSIYFSDVDYMLKDHSQYFSRIPFVLTKENYDQLLLMAEHIESQATLLQYSLYPQHLERLSILVDNLHD